MIISIDMYREFIHRSQYVEFQYLKDIGQLAENAVRPCAYATR